MTETKENKKLSALISLLDEPDDATFRKIRDQICSFGPDAIPELEKAWESNPGEAIQGRIEEIIKRIQQSGLVFEFRDWLAFASSDLLKGFLLVTRTNFPEINETGILTKIEQLRMDMWLEMSDDLTALENIRVINHILYNINLFDGNRVSLNAPQNNYINTLLETRKGSPLSLGMLYIILARKLNLPVCGVNLPQHFILGYLSDQNITSPTENDILFYINPFNKGTVFTRREIELFIRQLKLKPELAYFAPCTNVDIIQRLLKSLVYAWEQQGETGKVEDLRVLLSIIET